MAAVKIVKPELLDFETVPEVQVEIPQTTRERYITGLYALNVHQLDGTSGDWHDVYHWREGRDRPRVVTLGGSEDVDTNALFEDMGIYEGRSLLLAEGIKLPAEMNEVFIADHYRAILDLLYRSLTRYGHVLNLIGATTDWLDTPEQQEFVLEQATRMIDHFEPDVQERLVAWIARERRGRA